MPRLVGRAGFTTPAATSYTLPAILPSATAGTGTIARWATNLRRSALAFRQFTRLSLWPGGLRLELGPGVPEAEGAVEDEPSGRRVGIRAEVAEALELHGLTGRQFRERRLDQALLEHRLRVGVEVGVEVAVSAGIGAGEQTVIDTHLGGHGVLGREPVQRRLRPAPVGGVAAARLRIVGAAELDDLAARVLDHVGAGHEVGVAQTHFAAGGEAEELAWRVLHEVVAFDPELAREGHLACPGRGILRVVDGLHLLDLPLWVVLDHEPERAQDGEASQRPPVQHVPDLVLEHLDFGGARALASQRDHVEEVAQTLGREAAPAQGREGGHARIVPASHVALAHKPP